MAGRRSLQSSSISRLTSPPETIPSCYRRSRHTHFQPHSRRHQGCCFVVQCCSRFERHGNWAEEANGQPDRKKACLTWRATNSSGVSREPQRVSNTAIRLQYTSLRVGESCPLGYPARRMWEAYAAPRGPGQPPGLCFEVTGTESGSLSMPACKPLAWPPLVDVRGETEGVGHESRSHHRYHYR